MLKSDIKRTNAPGEGLINTASKSSEDNSLRQEAEEFLESKHPAPISNRAELSSEPLSLTDAETQKLIYELEVHQVELEMQNHELQISKRRIEASAEKYAELYDFSPSGYYTLSRDGEILELNLYGAHLLGKERVKLNMSRLGFFISEESKSDFDRFMTTLFATNTKASCDISLCSQNGSSPLIVHLTGIVAKGSEQCLITAVDITELKLAEEEINRKNRELQRVNAEKDKFFSIIAHDLRSPFNGFLGLTELMAEGASEMTLDEIQKIATMMKNSAINLNLLLGNLLEWSRMARGLISFHPETWLLRTGINNSLVAIQEAARTKMIRIDLVIPEEMVVYADKNMLESLFRNLVSNSVKFTPTGGSITISAKSTEKNRIEVSVKDLGIGMDQQMIDNLFNLDVNTDRKGTNGELSSGLGLQICRDIALKHGSRLLIESEVGRGSTFCFTLQSHQI